MRDIFIIAEAGCNHNGRLNIAKKLIRKAKDCGAGAVKFQTFLADDLLRRDMCKTGHLKNIKKGESVFDMMKNLEFSRGDYRQLLSLAKEQDIFMFSSVFDTVSLKLVNSLGMPILKIPSGEIVNLELLEAVGRCGKPVILSTGMSKMEEVDRAVNIISKNLHLRNTSGKLLKKYPFFQKRLILMHTVSTYPAREEELNLRAIAALKDNFDFPVGFSDHSLGDQACIIAVALGAEVIEKHFTLSRKLPGPDHKASFEPSELEGLVHKIQVTVKMLGGGLKRPAQSEKGMISLFRRALVAAADIKKDQVISRDMLQMKRPLDGIPCERMNEILGLCPVRDIKAGESIRRRFLKKNG